ncbi:MAG: hypothetical protein WCO09_03725 [bacterium]
MKYEDFASDDVIKISKENNYSYTACLDANKTDENSIYCNPLSQTLKYDLLAFNVGDLECELYAAEYQLVYADKLPKSTDGTPSRMAAAVFSIKLPFNTAPVYVESRTHKTLNNILGLSKIMFPKKTSVKLEGDFNQYFRVYTKDVGKLDAFTTLAPNVMVKILESMGEYDIEFSYDHIYIYFDMPYIIGDSTVGLKMPYSLIQLKELLQLGEDSANGIARASRPSKVVDTMSVEPFWKLQSAVSNKSVQFALFRVVLLFVVASTVLIFPLFWPIGLIVVIWLVYRYSNWEKRKNKLVERWQQGKIRLVIK